MNKQLSRALVLGLMMSASSTAAMAQYEYTSAYQPNLAQIGIDSTLHGNLKAYIANSAAAQNVGIAILDGRADSTHPDLRNSLSVHQVYRGNYRRADQHGTHVAGIAGASQNNTGIVGVAPFTKLYSIPVFDDRSWVASDLGRLALNRAVDLKANVANMSYGPTTPGDVFLSGELNIFDDYASSLVLVRAAGNNGVNAINESYAGNASSALAHLLIVGSVDRNNAISSFSNRPGSACFVNSSGCVAGNEMRNFFLVAPGSNIASDVPGGYAYLSGTSMAAPHVAGAAALVFQNALAGNTLLTPAQVAGILKGSATDLGTAGVDDVFGHGLLNVAAALAPVGRTSIATSSTVSGSTSSTSSTGNARLASSSVLGRSSVLESALNGMVIFDSYGRGFVMDNVRLSGPRSTLAEESVTALSASLLVEGEIQDTEHGRLSLFQNDGGTAGYSAFSFIGETYAIASGTGNTQAFFTQMPAAPVTGASHRLGSQFFTGAGDVGQSFTTGFFSSADVALTSALTFSALYASSAVDRLDGQSDWTDALADETGSSGLATGGVSLALKDLGTIGLSVGILREEDEMLGIQSDGAFSLGETAVTQMMGLSYSRGLTDRLSLDVFAQLGLTSTSGAEDSIFESVSDVWSTKMGLSVTGSSLLQPADRFQLSVVSPWRIVEGEAEASIAVGRELDGTVNYDTRRVSLAAGDLPLDLGFSYMVNAGKLSYGAALWLRDSDVAELSLDETVAAAGVNWPF